MSLNDTTFLVIAQTPHPPKKYLTMFFTPYCSLTQGYLQQRVVSISEIHDKFDHSLPSTLFLAQCNSLLLCFSTFILGSKKKNSLKANHMILFQSCSNPIATFRKTPAGYRIELPVLYSSFPFMRVEWEGALRRIIYMCTYSWLTSLYSRN